MPYIMYINLVILPKNLYVQVIWFYRRNNYFENTGLNTGIIILKCNGINIDII